MTIICFLLRFIMDKNKDKKREWTKGKSQKRKKIFPDMYVYMYMKNLSRVYIYKNIYNKLYDS